MRITDGKQAVYPVGKGPVHAQIESKGLFYSYSVPGKASGRIVFVLLAQVLQKLG